MSAPPYTIKGEGEEEEGKRTREEGGGLMFMLNSRTTRR
jgi:hypothetical protein